MSRGGVRPVTTPTEIAGEARCEKNQGRSGEKSGICERCEAPLVDRSPARTKRFCSERCQRNAEKQCFRERRTELAHCKRCGQEFERTATSKRLQVYCSLVCQRRHRSAIYRQRPDILANAAKARAAK